MSFTFLVWNVEKFKATTTSRIRMVADHIHIQDPDVICILEFMGKSSALNPSRKKDAARRLISEFLPEYDFGLTDSKKRLEQPHGGRAKIVHREHLRPLLAMRRGCLAR